MPFGYSYNFASEVQEKYKRDPANPVYELVVLCIEREIMLTEVARQLEVSRQAIYQWLHDVNNPKPETMTKIVGLNKKLRRQNKRV